MMKKVIFILILLLSVTFSSKADQLATAAPAPAQLPSTQTSMELRSMTTLATYTPAGLSGGGGFNTDAALTGPPTLGYGGFMVVNQTPIPDGAWAILIASSIYVLAFCLKKKKKNAII